MAILPTPLCPAGHLPRKGGDQPASRLSPISDVAGRCGAPKLPISPLEGEMSGRTEGGERQPCHAATPYPSSLRCPRA
ncbi:MAG: lytic murein transglycosylase [Mesorhizobium sp.]|nr:MAG: lytic murein transglycosylase [Mesorhizobium sp.]